MKPIVVIPTYNEKENVEAMAAAALANRLKADGFTNAVVTAPVNAFAGHIDDTYALRLTITDRHSHAVVLSKPVTGPGAYVFDTAEAESQEYLTGYGFDFTLELVDGDGSVVADEVTVNGALNFANRTSWFAASAAILASSSS